MSNFYIGFFGGCSIATIIFVVMQVLCVKWIHRPKTKYYSAGDYKSWTTTKVHKNGDVETRFKDSRGQYENSIVDTYNRLLFFENNCIRRTNRFDIKGEKIYKKEEDFSRNFVSELWVEKAVTDNVVDRYNTMYRDNIINETIFIDKNSYRFNLGLVDSIAISEAKRKHKEDKEKEKNND